MADNGDTAQAVRYELLLVLMAARAKKSEELSEQQKTTEAAYNRAVGEQQKAKADRDITDREIVTLNDQSEQAQRTLTDMERQMIDLQQQKDAVKTTYNDVQEQLANKKGIRHQQTAVIAEWDRAIIGIDETIDHQNLEQATYSEEDGDNKIKIQSLEDNLRFKQTDNERLRALLGLRSLEDSGNQPTGPCYALMCPAPYQETAAVFSAAKSAERGGQLFKANMFVNFLNNPDYLVNRLWGIAIAKHQALSLNTVNPSSGSQVASVIDWMPPEYWLSLLDGSSKRLTSTAKQAHLLVRLAEIYNEDVEIEQARLRGQPSACGDRTILARSKHNVATKMIMDMLQKQGLPITGNTMALQITQLQDEVTMGTCLKQIFQVFSSARASCLVLPLAELLEIRGTTNLRDMHRYTTDWFLGIIEDRKNAYLRIFVSRSCQLVCEHHYLDGPDFDIAKFAEALDKVRIQYRLTKQPPHQPLSEIPGGDYALALAAGVSGYDTDNHSVVTVVGFRDRSYELGPPAEMFPGLVGMDKDGHAIDMCQRGIKAVLVTLAKGPNDREIAVFPGLINPERIKNNDLVVSVVRVNDIWVPVTIRVAKESDKLTVTQLFIFDLAQLQTQEATAMYEHIKQAIEKDREFVFTKDTVSFAWPVQKLDPAHRNCSGIHALCHALSILSEGHVWLGGLTAERVLEFRNLFLRAVTRKLIETEK
ncbi:hypothetical protein N0V82_010871 [Gnomoniopsis sp. IMI 355080]|nr:hypothetical protein N0V82_010871 [Gnomoniopsis sp. IMI 355080]